MDATAAHAINTNSLNSSHEDFADTITQKNMTPRVYMDLKNDMKGIGGASMERYNNQQQFKVNK